MHSSSFLAQIKDKNSYWNFSDLEPSGREALGTIAQNVGNKVRDLGNSRVILKFFLLLFNFVVCFN